MLKILMIDLATWIFLKQFCYQLLSPDFFLLIDLVRLIHNIMNVFIRKFSIKSWWMENHMLYIFPLYFWVMIRVLWLTTMLPPTPPPYWLVSCVHTSIKNKTSGFPDVIFSLNNLIFDFFDKILCYFAWRCLVTLKLNLEYRTSMENVDCVCHYDCIFRLFLVELVVLSSNRHE